MRPADTDPIERTAEVDFFATIEETFVRLRGKHLFVGPADWQLMEDWKSRGIPVHVVLTAIQGTFTKFKAKNPTGTISSLSYCARAVEEANRQWISSRVGAHDNQPSTSNVQPFGPEAIIAHISRTRAALTAPWIERAPALANAIHATDVALELLQSQIGRNGLSAHSIEEKLGEFEANLDEVIRSVAGQGTTIEIGEAVTAMLNSYKSKMPENDYQKTFDGLFMKKLRERFNVPRLSLFFAK